MNEPAIYETLTRIFRDLFDNEELTISAATHAAHLADWDSNRNVEIITAVEAKFGFRFPTGEVGAMKNVGDMVRIIQKRHRP